MSYGNTFFFQKEKYVAFAREHKFTKKETEVGLLLANGFSNIRISEELYISITTVKKHITHIYEKSNIYCRKEFITYFL